MKLYSLLLLSIIILSPFSIAFLPIGTGFAAPPSYSRQEISGPSDQWTWSWKECPFQLSVWKQYVVAAPNIAAVSYFSDGKILNGTIMMSSPLHKVSSYLAYRMVILPIAFHNTFELHRAGLYVVEIGSGNDPNQKWYKRTYEVYSNGFVRTLENTSNYTGFLDKERKSISFSVDLRTISFPSEYQLEFNAYNAFKVGERYCTLIDDTNWDQIPPPEYIISTVPHSLSLRPGEEANVELQIATTLKVVGSDVSLSAAHPGQIEVSLSPSNLTLRPDGISAAFLHVKAPQESGELPITYTIPISAKVSLQGGTFLSQGSGILIPSMSIPENVYQNYDNLTVTLLKKPSFGEVFSDFWNKFGGAISLVFGGLGAGGIGILVDRLRRNRRADR